MTFAAMAATVYAVIFHHALVAQGTASNKEACGTNTTSESLLQRNSPRESIDFVTEVDANWYKDQDPAGQMSPDKSMFLGPDNSPGGNVNPCLPNEPVTKSECKEFGNFRVFPNEKAKFYGEGNYGGIAGCYRTNSKNPSWVGTVFYNTNSHNDPGSDRNPVCSVRLVTTSTTTSLTPSPTPCPTPAPTTTTTQSKKSKTQQKKTQQTKTQQTKTSDEKVPEADLWPVEKTGGICSSGWIAGHKFSSPGQCQQSCAKDEACEWYCQSTTALNAWHCFRYTECPSLLPRTQNGVDVTDFKCSKKLSPTPVMKPDLIVTQEKAEKGVAFANQ